MTSQFMILCSRTDSRDKKLKNRQMFPFRVNNSFYTHTHTHTHTHSFTEAVLLTHPSLLTRLSFSTPHPVFHSSPPSSVGRIWSPAQLRCHGNSSLLQHLLSPTSFHPSVVQPPVVTLSPFSFSTSSSTSSSPSLCSSDGPLSAPVHQRGNPFLWR